MHFREHLTAFFWRAEMFFSLLEVILKTRIKIVVVYNPVSVWDYPYEVTTRCADGTTFDEAVAFAKSLTDVMDEAESGDYYIKSVSVVVTSEN